MKILGTHAFVNQVLAGLIVTIGFGGSVGLGTVWMRHQISVVADTNATLQRQIVETERRIADTSALVEEAMRADVLRRKNHTMQLGMTELNGMQVIPVNQDPVLRLAARASRRVFESEMGGQLARIQLNVQQQAVAAQPSAQEPNAQNASRPANSLMRSSVGAAASVGTINFAPRQ